MEPPKQRRKYRSATPAAFIAIAGIYLLRAFFPHPDDIEKIAIVAVLALASIAAFTIAFRQPKKPLPPVALNDDNRDVVNSNRFSPTSIILCGIMAAIFIIFFVISHVINTYEPSENQIRTSNTQN